MIEREPQILDVAEQQAAIERVINPGLYNPLYDLPCDQWTAFFADLEEVGITSLGLSDNMLNNVSPDQWAAFFAGLKGEGSTSLELSDNKLNNLSPDQLKAVCEGSKDSDTKEIQKNARVLGYLRYDTDSRFSKLPVQLLVNIASGMGKDDCVIENDKRAYEIVKQNFPSIDSNNEQDASQKADEEFQKYSATFKF